MISPKTGPMRGTDRCVIRIAYARGRLQWSQRFSVIHGHDVKLWAALLEEEATATQKGVEYGTPEMAYAVRNLFKVTDVKRRKIFAMAGHEGGVVAFGRDVGEAFGVLSRAKGSPRRVRPAANREQPSGD